MGILMKSRCSSFCHPLNILPLKILLCMCYNKKIIVETTICLSNAYKDHYSFTTNNNKKKASKTL
jgi:hypothetical protein